MTTYNPPTDGEIEPRKKIKATVHRRIRDMLISLLEGDASAPRLPPVSYFRPYFEADYLASGSLLVPRNGYAELILAGGGGGGGASSDFDDKTLASGGGGGGVCHAIISVSAGDVLTWTIGGGGNGAAEVNGTSNGSPGGSSVISGPNGFSMTAGGGAGGRGIDGPGTAAGAIGGLCSGDGVHYPGQPSGSATGTDGSATTATGGGACQFGGADAVLGASSTVSSRQNASIAGGSSGILPFYGVVYSGGFGRSQELNTSAEGGAGQPGCGGGGAANVKNSETNTSASAGSGGGGFLIIRYFTAIDAMA